MIIRVYPDNAYERNEISEGLEFDAVPRVGDFVNVPFSIEKEWAKNVLKYDVSIAWFSQWLVGGERIELDFGDAMYVTKVWWGYCSIQKKMVCFMALDASAEYRRADKDLPELKEEDYDIIRRNTEILYELNE